MAVSASKPPPSSSALRVDGLDFARSLAFLGMVFVNFRTSIVPKGRDVGWLAWINERIDGRAAATFVTLAGVGLSLMSRRARLGGDAAMLSSVRQTIARRAVFLFVIGLLYWPLWPADILHYYGVYLAIGTCLITARDRTLLILAGSLVLAFAFLIVGGADYSHGWNWDSLSYTGFWTPLGFLRNLIYNGFHPVIPWFAFLLFGMWLGRRDLLDAQLQARLIAVALPVIAVTEVSSRWLIRKATPKLGAEDATSVFGTAPMPPMPLYMIAASATAVVVICLCAGIARKAAGARWIQPFLATGQLAMTLYVAHVVFGIVPLEMSGVLDGRRNVVTSTVCGLTFCVAAVVFAWAWRRKYSRGPLELVMRKITATSDAGPATPDQSADDKPASH
jgi:uncharacterized membrane protein YeiB